MKKKMKKKIKKMKKIKKIMKDETKSKKLLCLK